MASRRVYVLGAGVSASCGIPVAKDILRVAMLKLAQDSPTKADQVHALLAYLYPSFDEHLRTYPNIEDFLNQVEMAREFNTEVYLESKVWPKQRLQDVGNITLKAVTDFLWDYMQRKEKFEIARNFAEAAIEPGDVVITFNWDTTLEHALHLHRKEPTFVYKYSIPRSNSELSLLKPHGSIDWFKKTDLPKGLKPEDVEVLDKQLSAYTWFDFRNSPGLAEKSPVIVPPVSHKRFEYTILNETWTSIYWAVSQATKLYILGYSLPPEDQFARFVFRRAIFNNVSNSARGKKKPLSVRVYNPDPSVAVAFSRIIGPARKGLDQNSFEAVKFEDLTDAITRNKMLLD